MFEKLKSFFSKKLMVAVGAILVLLGGGMQADSANWSIISAEIAAIAIAYIIGQATVDRKKG